MKKIFLWLVVWAFSSQLWGQSTVQVTPGANIISKNGAYIVLNNVHLINNGTIQQINGDGTFKFTGNSDVNMGGTGTVLDKLMLSKDAASKLTMTSNIRIISQINFQGGLLNLSNYKADLGTTGQLANESELSRAYTTGTGYIEAMGNLNKPSSVNLGNLGAIISSPVNMGNTTIRRGHKVQTGISGSVNSIERFYDISPTNNIALKATLRIMYFDTELNGINESDLNQWKSKNNTTWALEGFTKRDATENYVEKKTIGWFARWTLAPGSPEALIITKSVDTKVYSKDQSINDRLTVKVLPNPFSDNFTLITASGSDSPVTVRILDASGRIVETRSNVSANSSLRIGNQYRQGIYFVEVIQGKEKVVLKLIKQSY